MNIVKNQNINLFNNKVSNDVLVICINYTKDEFNYIKKENYVNADGYGLFLLKKYERFVFNIKFCNENIKNTIRIIKKIKRYFNFCNFFNKNIGTNVDGDFIIANIETTDNKNNLYFSIESSLLAMTIKNKRERLKFVYEKACIYLNREIVDKNICGFVNDKCIVKANTNCTMGCCHHYPHKRTGIFRNEELQLCEYQVNGTCVANCITCKMYMCPDMEKKGYRYNVFNVPLINCFFNIIQKLILSVSFFTTEEDIMKMLVKF